MKTLNNTHYSRILAIIEEYNVPREIVSDGSDDGESMVVIGLRVKQLGLDHAEHRTLE